MATAGPGDFVKVTYLGRQIPVRDRNGIELDRTYDNDTPLTIGWDGRFYEIPVGGSQFVPFDAMANAAGDPRSTENMQSLRDTSGNTFFVLDRKTELRRLRSLYDNQTGSEDVVDFAPMMEVYDLEGEQIVTVLDDPQGLTSTPVVQTVMDHNELKAQIARQQRLIDTLAAQQGIDLNDPDIVKEPEPEPLDDPLSEPPEDK